MVQYTAIQALGEFDGAVPTNQMSGSEVMSKLRRTKCIINLANQPVLTTADWVLLTQLPPDADFSFGILTENATMGTSVIAIGTSAVHGTNGQYRAAAVATAVDTPALFGLTAAIAAPPLTAPTNIYLTLATASLPAAGIISVDVFFSSRS